MVPQGSPVPASCSGQVPDGPQDVGAQGLRGVVLEQSLEVRARRILEHVAFGDGHVGGTLVHGEPVGDGFPSVHKA